MVKFNALVAEQHKYDYVDSHLSGKVKRFRINNPDEPSTFAAGLGKWGLLNLRNEVVIPAIYDEIWPFREGLALSKKGEKYGYLADTGAIAIPFIYDHAEDFTNGYAEVSKQGKDFYIDYMNEKITLNEINYKKLKLKPTKVVPLASESIPWHKRKESNFQFISVFGGDDAPIKFKTKIAAETTPDKDKDKDKEDNAIINNLLTFFKTNSFNKGSQSPHFKHLGTLNGLVVLPMNRNVKMYTITTSILADSTPEDLGLTKDKDPNNRNPARGYCLKIARELGITKDDTTVEKATKELENHLYFVAPNKAGQNVLYLSNEKVTETAKTNWDEETVGDYTVVRTTDSIIIKTPSA